MKLIIAAIALLSLTPMAHAESCNTTCNTIGQYQYCNTNCW